MSDIGFDGILGAFAAMFLAAIAVLWAVVAFAMSARKDRGRTPYVGAMTLGGYAFVTYALINAGARQLGDWIGIAGLLVAPILAIVLTLRSRKA